MAAQDDIALLSKHRLGGEPVPPDLAVLLAHKDAFAKRTDVTLYVDPDWAPRMLDRGYLSDTERADPLTQASCDAMDEVCRHIAFFAGNEDDSLYYGYWRGESGRAIADSPVVCLDCEGQFDLMPGMTFVDGLLLYEADDPDWYREERGWFKSIGAPVPSADPGEVEDLEADDNPDEMYRSVLNQLVESRGIQVKKSGCAGAAAILCVIAPTVGLLIW